MSIKIQGEMYYTIPEVAKALNKTPRTIWKHTKSGKIKGVRIGRPILITQFDIEKFLNTPIITTEKKPQIGFSIIL